MAWRYGVTTAARVELARIRAAGGRRAVTGLWLDARLSPCAAQRERRPRRRSCSLETETPSARGFRNDVVRHTLIKRSHCDPQNTQDETRRRHTQRPSTRKVLYSGPRQSQKPQTASTHPLESDGRRWRWSSDPQTQPHTPNLATRSPRHSRNFSLTPCSSPFPHVTSSLCRPPTRDARTHTDRVPYHTVHPPLLACAPQLSRGLSPITTLRPRPPKAHSIPSALPHARHIRNTQPPSAGGTALQPQREQQLRTNLAV